MLSKLRRQIVEVLEEKLHAKEVEPLGFVVERCPQCRRLLEEGWIKSSEGSVCFHPGSWQNFPSEFATGNTLSNKFRWNAPLKGGVLAAARCHACKLVLLKYENYGAPF